MRWISCLGRRILLTGTQSIGVMTFRKSMMLTIEKIAFLNRVLAIQTKTLEAAGLTDGERVSEEEIEQVGLEDEEYTTT